MKTKMFKKMFAAVLAASTVMAMSGGAMAAKKGPATGKSHKTSKNPNKSGKKVMKLKKIKARGKEKNEKDKQSSQQEIEDIYKNRPVNTLNAVDGLTFYVYDGEDIDNDEESNLDCATEHFYTAIFGIDDMLSQDCCNDRFVLKTTNEIRRLKNENHISGLKNCRKEKEMELVDALVKWAKADNITVKRNIAVAIGDLAQGGYFNDLFKEKKADILDALIKCFEQDASIKTDVAWAFKRLVESGFVNENEPSEEVLKLKEILNDCKDTCDIVPHLDVDDESDSDSCEI